MVLNRRYIRQGLLRLMLMLVGYIPLMALAGDSYTDALNAEADQVVVDPESEKQNIDILDQAAPQGGWSNQDQSMSQDLPANLEQEDFEEALKLNFYGSYMFYNRLDESQQDEVFEFYQNKPSIEPVRQRIIELKKSL